MKPECDVEFRSASFDNKPDENRYGFIRIDGKEVLRVDFNGANSKRGISTMVLDQETWSPGMKKSFDTHEYQTEATELVNYLNSLSSGTLLLGISFDDSTSSLGPALATFKSLGADVENIGYRGMFAFAMQKGFPSKTVLAKSASGPSALRLTVQLSGKSYWNNGMYLLYIYLSKYA